jgi:hypothetical protein
MVYHCLVTGLYTDTSVKWPAESMPCAYRVAATFAANAQLVGPTARTPYSGGPGQSVTPLGRIAAEGVALGVGDTAGLGSAAGAGAAVGTLVGVGDTAHRARYDIGFWLLLPVRTQRAGYLATR